MMLRREPQRIGSFVAGDPESGYYNDLTVEALKRGTAGDARRWLAQITEVRELANPVTVAQLGLGAWTLAKSDGAWQPVAETAAEWLVAQLDDRGRIPYLFPMRHTFALDPPWLSAMAQGEAASLLVRVGARRDEREFVAAASAAVRPLLSEASELVAPTPDGPVLQEYPTSPAAHVLNGWVFALWGLYDVACVDPTARVVAAAFDVGVDTLARRVHLYRAWPRWSRYDLFPHPLPNVASPFYHRLHVAQLQALQAIAPRPEIESELSRWAGGASSPAGNGIGLLRKVAFRVVRPRTGLRALPRYAAAKPA